MRRRHAALYDRIARMAIDLKEVVPWGRTFDEYVRMFSLALPDLLARRIVDVAAGPASFNAEMHTLGRRVISVDPLYAHPAAAVRRRIDEAYPTIVEGCRRDAHRFRWTEYRDADHLGRHRMAAMTCFLADYDAGLADGRYLARSLPALDFPAGSFDLALCSHFLFLYSTQLGRAFHLAAVAELCRVAAEVRIFPLLDMEGRRSDHLDATIAWAPSHGISAEVRRTLYEFQLGANEMLVLRPISSGSSPAAAPPAPSGSSRGDTAPPPAARSCAERP
jgi:SAM-dependent methyltransferase